MYGLLGGNEMVRQVIQGRIPIDDILPEVER